jgi:hypothetical protein
VTALQRSDFTLKENGVKHDIAAVAYMTSAERTIAVPAEPRNADTPGFLAVALRPSGCTSRRKRIPPTSRACAMRCAASCRSSSAGIQAVDWRPRIHGLRAEAAAADFHAAAVLRRGERESPWEPGSSPGVKGFVPLMPRDAGGEPVTRHPPVLRASLPGVRREGWN